ncbi:MAG: peptidoglycan DD-metalloendopeptidase family protein [Patescibacteria group bacterium]
MRHHQRLIPPGRNFQSRNKALAKKTAIQLLAIVGNLLLLLIKLAAGIFILLGSILRLAGRFVLRAALLPLYSLFKKITAKLASYLEYLRQQLGENFGRNMVIYGGLSVLTLFATASNLKAREERPEDIGRTSSLYVLLIQNSDAEIYYEDSGQAAASTAPGNKNDGQDLLALGVQSNVETLGSAADDANNQFLSGSGDALFSPDLTGTEITPVRREKIITYTVQDGDTISEIAEQFDISTNTLLWENNLGPRDFIKPGQTLSILPVTGVAHTVKKGDSLNAIASRYRAKSEDILEINKLADASDIAVGQKIIIPDGIPVPSQAAAAPRPAAPNRNLGSIFKNAPAASGHFNWPTTSKRISQYFRGWRHTGLDIAAPTGQPVYASEAGVVITAGWNRGGYGYYIIIDHGDGIQTLYGHNSKLAVERGDRVTKGQVIASVGSTGRSTGPHVHYEVRVNGNRVNPLDYL